jgi:pyruvate dehydrogenase E1 component alpha subunit
MAQVTRAKKKNSVRSSAKPSAKSSAKTAKAAAECAVLRDDCYRILNEKNIADPKREPKLDKALLVRMYRNMVLTRAFDERGMMLQRQGRIGFYVPSTGQEAIQTGTAAALDERDWIFPSYREPGVSIYRGASLHKMLCNLWGNSDDVCKGRQMPVHYSFADLRIFSISSPIATQVIQAVGVSMASQIKKEKDVAITYFGDGGTSENDFHTGLTFAGAFKSPTVFICTNNQYAISVPFHKQTGCKRLVDKAIGYGMPGVAVDGNDVLAVYTVTKQAVERARRGEGPTFIECLTLRMGPHSSSDDPTRYRDEALYQAWKLRDPIDRFRAYLTGKKLWSDAQEAALKDELKELISQAIQSAEPVAPPTVEELFSDVYSEKTPQLIKQEAELVHERELRGKFINTSEAFPL